LSNPDSILNNHDPGDDVQRRFRYQAAYAAILSVAMLQEDSKISEVFCELHEDVLLKLQDGNFQGVQVKTRMPHLGPFDIHDSEIEKSLTRFVAIDGKFKDKFAGFTITTNNAFSKEKNKCLRTLCQMAKDGKSAELLKARSYSKKWIEALAKKCGVTAAEIIHVLSRLRLRDDYSTLDDISGKLFQALLANDNIKSQTSGTVSKICDELIAKHSAAAALNHDSPLEENFILGVNPTEEKVQAIIKGKQITKDLVAEIISKAITDPIKLFIKDSKGINALPKGDKLLETKMDAGGLAIENIQLIKDQKYSFETLTASWLYKMDADEASRRYDQVKMIVQNECQEAHDEEKVTDKVYGTNMLVNVRKRLRTRYEKEKTSFFDFSYDHLLGVVGSLTEECTVWWSTKFEIEK
jgi:hypothetical protein